MSQKEPSGRFAWLLGTGNPRLARHEITEDDLETACRFLLDNWQVAPIAIPRLKEWAEDGLENCPSWHRLRKLSIAAQALTRVQVLLSHRLTSALQDASIPYVLLKGSAMRFKYYPSLDSRCGKDVDLGTSREYLASVDAVLRRQGFQPASLNLDGRHFHLLEPTTMRRVEDQHYELACRVRRQRIEDMPSDVEAAIRESLDLLKPWHLRDDGGIGCYVTVDVHHALSLDIPLEETLRTSEEVDHGEMTARIPCPAWLALHLVFKLYWEGVHNYGKGGYQFADLARLAPELQGETAMTFLGLLEHFNLEAAGFYTLRRLESHFDLELAQELRVFLDIAAKPPEDSQPLDANDLGDLWPRVWGWR